MDSFISWAGGKKALRRKILEQFPPKYSRYIEVFGGAGWVLFAEERSTDLEVYNDMDGSLVNLFRCVKYHPDALQKELDWMLYSRECFLDAGQESRGLTDIQRAARFFLLVQESFGAQRHSFAGRKYDIEKAVGYLREVSARLNKVTIEHLDFERLLQIYDRPDALFYLDPPYLHAEQYYHVPFGVEDHKRLREALGRIQGQFLLSYNNCEEARGLYKEFVILEVDRGNNLSPDRGKRYPELLIKNY